MERTFADLMPRDKEKMIQPRIPQIQPQSTLVADDFDMEEGIHSRTFDVAKKPEKVDEINVQVVDQNRNLTRDFKCNADLLKRYMKFFAPHLKQTGKRQVDISVHSDVKIFEWLLSYMQYSEYRRLVAGADGPFVTKHQRYRKGQRRDYVAVNLGFLSKIKQGVDRLKHEPAPEQPILDLKNVISIMISAEFLQMEPLIHECISYILCNLADVVRLPIDMDCISDGLAQRLAGRTPVRVLIGLYDKRDKLRSRLLGLKTL